MIYLNYLNNIVNNDIGMCGELIKNLLLKLMVLILSILTIKKNDTVHFHTI